jgi:hypothetical protein
VATDPTTWFHQLGYTLDVTRDDAGVFWASLTAIANPDFVVLRYGRGVTIDEASERARQRWQVEQIGSPQDPDSTEHRLP